ncbi:MAG: FAD-linked oxidase C-terminal domain-containing protein, partial [Neisseria elongata]
AISIEQKTTSKNPRSTVGTVTEIHDYMRLLWARVGIPYSPATGLPADEIRAAVSQAGGHATLFRGALRAGETAFTLPQENVLRIQRRLKKLFDPHNILNRGRMPGLA